MKTICFFLCTEDEAIWVKALYHILGGKKPIFEVRRKKDGDIH